MKAPRLELDHDGDLILWRPVLDPDGEPDTQLILIGDPFDPDAVAEKLWHHAADEQQYDALEEQYRALVSVDTLDGHTCLPGA